MMIIKRLSEKREEVKIQAKIENELFYKWEELEADKMTEEEVDNYLSDENKHSELYKSWVAETRKTNILKKELLTLEDDVFDAFINSIGNRVTAEEKEIMDFNFKKYYVKRQEIIEKILKIVK